MSGDRASDDDDGIDVNSMSGSETSVTYLRCGMVKSVRLRPSMNWLAIAVSLASTVETVGLGVDDAVGVVFDASLLGRAIAAGDAVISSSAWAINSRFVISIKVL